MAKKDKKAKKKLRRTTQSAEIKPIPINVGVNIQSNASSVSWGSAFAAASNIRPNDADLDDEFLQRTKASDNATDQGVVSVARLARGYKSPPLHQSGTGKSMYSKDKSNYAANKFVHSSAYDESDISIESQDTPLEGKIVDELMVLVNKQNGHVYSSEARMPNGKRLVIGKVVNGKIELDRNAINETNPNNSLSSGPSFPYPTNPDDHCETPLESYHHILPILDELTKSRGGKRSKLRIYDPYYCNGSVVKHLESLGYTNVYNRKEDCYDVWKSNKEPKFDVLLTNPPYSEDHIEKLMVYLTSQSFGTKPFLLLMPQWVHKKDYYINATTGGSEKIQGKKRKREHTDNSLISPFYVVPKKRYVYLPPPDFREKKVSDVHKKSSPFTSMWYVWGGSHEMNETLVNTFKKSDVKSCELARSRSALRDLRRAGKKKAKSDK